MRHVAVPESLNDIVALELRGLRERAGITQRVLANATGIPRPMITRYERGTAELTLRRLCDLAAYFEVDASAILRKAEKRGGNGKKKAPNRKVRGARKHRKV